LKIYTKTGDGGTTGLRGGRRVSKSDNRVKAYGNIDETICYFLVIITKTHLPLADLSVTMLDNQKLMLSKHFMGIKINCKAKADSFIRII